MWLVSLSFHDGGVWIFGIILDQIVSQFGHFITPDFWMSCVTTEPAPAPSSVPPASGSGGAGAGRREYPPDSLMVILGLVISIGTVFGLIRLGSWAKNRDWSEPLWDVPPPPVHKFGDEITEEELLEMSKHWVEDPEPELPIDDDCESLNKDDDSLPYFDSDEFDD